METGQAAQFFIGASVGVGVLFAVLAASTASVRAGESWAARNIMRATAFASAAGISSIAALGGIVYGLLLVAWNSPVAT